MYCMLLRGTNRTRAVSTIRLNALMASYVYKHSLPGLILAAAERVFAVSKTNNDRKLAVILVADVAG